MPIDSIIEKITSETGLSEKEVEQQIQKKMSDMEGLVSEEGAAYIIASELGVQLFKDIGAGAIKVKDILAGMKSVEFVGRVTRTYPVRTFEREGQERMVGSFVAGDETGNIRVVIWDPRVDWITEGKLKEGIVIKVKDAYAKQSNMGGIEVHLNARSALVLNPQGVSVEAQASREQYESAVVKKIAEVNDGEAVKLLGTVVQAFAPRFYDLCPQCGKKAARTPEGFYCETHKTIQPGMGMILNLVLDDGTETIRATAFRERAERLLGLNAKECSEILAADGEQGLADRVNESLLGRNIEAEGRIKYNEQYDRKEMIINRANKNPDAGAIALQLLKEKKTT